jgi:hypothetical protein
MLMSKTEDHISQSQVERVAAGKPFVFLVTMNPQLICAGGPSVVKEGRLRMPIDKIERHVIRV